MTPTRPARASAVLALLIYRPPVRGGELLPVVALDYGPAERSHPACSAGRWR